MGHYESYNKTENDKISLNREESLEAFKKEFPETYALAMIFKKQIEAYNQIKNYL